MGCPFDFAQVSFTGEFLAVYHIGLNRKLNRNLTVGTRLKFYSGIFNVESIDNTGTFLTIETPAGPNYYRHFADDLNLIVNTSGFASLRDNNNNIEEADDDLLSQTFFEGNKWLMIDA